MSKRREGKGRSFAETREEINAGRLRPVYLMHGSDARLREDLLHCLRQACLHPGMEDFNYLSLDGDAALPREVRGHLQTAPLLGGRRLVVVHDLPLFLPRLTDGEEEMPVADEAGWIEVVRQLYGGVLVFTLRQPADGRRRLYREVAAAGGVVDCSSLAPGDVIRWLRKRGRDGGKELPPAVAETLVSVAGTDLHRLANELDKVVAYAGEDGVLTPEHLQAVVTGETAWEVFALTDAVAARRGPLALTITRGLLDAGERPLRLLALLGRQVRMLLVARVLREQGQGPDQAAGELGVPAWVARQYLQQAAGFRQDELEWAVEALVEADLAVKSGRREGGLAVELLVAALSGDSRR